jgi:hypothetical protein
MATSNNIFQSSLPLPSNNPVMLVFIHVTYHSSSGSKPQPRSQPKPQSQFEPYHELEPEPKSQHEPQTVIVDPSIFYPNLFCNVEPNSSCNIESNSTSNYVPISNSIVVRKSSRVN